MKNRDKNIEQNYNAKTGFFEDGLTYARIGNKSKIIVNIEALSFSHEPPSGFMLKQFVRSTRSFLDEYTMYLIGRKQNVPEDYNFTDMASDYAKLIQREFNEPVIIMGVSTGGQIAQYLAANHPDVVKKLIIISAAYRVSEKGAEIEKKAAEYFAQGKYGKSLATIEELLYSSRIIRSIAKSLTRLFGKRFMGNLKYPNDFLTEVQGDFEMNFKNRLNDIKAPTLILSGESDIAYPVEYVQETAEGIPNSKLILYKGYGHNLMMFNRKKVEKDILEFLHK